eukprot:1144328-Pelagomonas_calceolata.AAC.5
MMNIENSRQDCCLYGMRLVWNRPIGSQSLAVFSQPICFTKPSEAFASEGGHHCVGLPEAISQKGYFSKAILKKAISQKGHSSKRPGCPGPKCVSAMRAQLLVNTLILLVRGHPGVSETWSRSGCYINIKYKNNALHLQNAQEAFRRVPVKKQQPNFELQARCVFWPRLALYPLDITPIMSCACRKVARGHGVQMVAIGEQD